MTNANFHVFGIGSCTDNLHIIGWTDKSVVAERAQIYSELAENGHRDIAQWVRGALGRGKIDIFEIEAASSAQDASDSAQFWCEYYRWLGFDVITSPC